MSAGGTTRPRLLFRVFLHALCGAVIGLMLGLAFPLPGRREVRAYPLPHHVARTEGGVTLRFAMVHDVLHERFVRHGPEFYRERNRLARKKRADMEKAKLERAPAYFALLDDLAAGLEQLGQPDEAVQLLRDKLAQQQAQGLTGRDLYTTYANLGTFLTNGAFRAGVTGEDEEERGRLREGLGLIRKSMEVNPQAHFGRQVWQLAAVQLLLAALDKPEVLLKYDLVGNRLDREVRPGGPTEMYQVPRWRREGVAAFLRDPEGNAQARENLRETIPKVGAEDGWKEAVPGSHTAPVPFDEPALGIVGLWRQASGANPHFALALGETMLRVGQRYIAWTAYERATRMSDRFWPDATVQKKLVDHCRGRQKAIERGLPEEDRSQLRRRFDAELAYGERYGREYQEHEARRIRAGANIEDEHFDDDFYAGRKPIATKPGTEDRQLIESNSDSPLNLPLIALCAGLFALPAALWLRRETGQPDTPSKGG